MRTVLLAATMFVLCLTDATGQGKLLTNDPLTGLPLIPGAQGENTDAYAVAYERYQPGISGKTINSLAHGNIVCQ
jgi:hypothetical protein